MNTYSQDNPRPIEDSLTYLKECLDESAALWKQNREDVYIKDCLSLLDAINIIEVRLYGKEITNISFF